MYAIKEVEAKTLEKLNEYKVRNSRATSFKWPQKTLNLTDWCLGGSGLTVQGAKPPDGAAVLWVLLLRDHVQHL